MARLQDPSGALRPIDFEGACPVASRGLAPLGSEGYVAPEWLDGAADQVSCDLFALGVSCYQLLVGSRSLGASSSRIAASPIGRRRRGLGPEIKQLINGLLDANPGRRPSARTVAEVMSAAATSS
ncbi:protein kinase domain-containing protein [Streptomyces malaysiensis]|uniref:protein kinase domain-containing protein n=1 Tax=Streptomyces malaysiensis TaxID=92644 RepID=UPI004048C60A